MQETYVNQRTIVQNRHTQSGFTLIELLVVIAIIGILASTVLASLNSARGRARDATLMQQAQDYAKLIELDYLAVGHYQRLQKNWKRTVDACTGTFYAGNEGASAKALCEDMVATAEKGPYTRDNDRNYFYTGVPLAYGGTQNYYSVMIWLPGSGKYFCVGSSGRTYIGPANPGSGAWTGSGCAYNP